MRVEKWNAETAHEIRQLPGKPRPARSRPEHDQGALRAANKIGRAIQGRAACDRNFDRVQLHWRNVVCLLRRNVFGQFDKHGSRPFLLRQPEGIAHDGRNGRRTDDLPCHFGQGRHSRDNVYNLETPLLARKNTFLAGDHDHRHGAEQSIGRTVGEVERARTERRQTHAGAACQSSLRGRHEGGRLLMPGDDELDAGSAQRFDDIEILFPGYPENPLDTLILQSADKQIGALHSVHSCGWWPLCQFSALSKYGIHLSLLGLVACEQVTAISLAAS